MSRTLNEQELERFREDLRLIAMLDLDVALIALEHEDPQLARLVELRFFSGMSHAEIAAAEQCSVSTVERGWRLARAFLHQRLHRSHEA